MSYGETRATSWPTFKYSDHLDCGGRGSISRNENTKKRKRGIVDPVSPKIKQDESDEQEHNGQLKQRTVIDLTLDEPEPVGSACRVNASQNIVQPAPSTASSCTGSFHTALEESKLVLGGSTLSGMSRPRLTNKNCEQTLMAESAKDKVRDLHTTSNKVGSKISSSLNTQLQEKLKPREWTLFLSEEDSDFSDETSKRPTSHKHEGRPQNRDTATRATSIINSSDNCRLNVHHDRKPLLTSHSCGDRTQNKTVAALEVSVNKGEHGHQGNLHRGETPGHLDHMRIDRPPNRDVFFNAFISNSDRSHNAKPLRERAPATTPRHNAGILPDGGQIKPVSPGAYPETIDEIKGPDAVLLLLSARTRLFKWAIMWPFWTKLTNIRISYKAVGWRCCMLRKIPIKLGLGIIRERNVFELTVPGEELMFQKARSLLLTLVPSAEKRDATFCDLDPTTADDIKTLKRLLFTALQQQAAETPKPLPKLPSTHKVRPSSLASFVSDVSVRKPAVEILSESKCDNSTEFPSIAFTPVDHQWSGGDDGHRKTARSRFGGKSVSLEQLARYVEETDNASEISSSDGSDVNEDHCVAFEYRLFRRETDFTRTHDAGPSEWIQCGSPCKTLEEANSACRLEFSSERRSDCPKWPLREWHGSENDGMLYLWGQSNNGCIEVQVDRQVHIYGEGVPPNVKKGGLPRRVWEVCCCRRPIQRTISQASSSTICKSSMVSEEPPTENAQTSNASVASETSTQHPDNDLDDLFEEAPTAKLPETQEVRFRTPNVSSTASDALKGTEGCVEAAASFTTKTSSCDPPKSPIECEDTASQPTASSAPTVSTLLTHTESSAAASVQSSCLYTTLDQANRAAIKQILSLRFPYDSQLPRHIERRNQAAAALEQRADELEVNEEKLSEVVVVGLDAWEVWVRERAVEGPRNV